MPRPWALAFAGATVWGMSGMTGVWSGSGLRRDDGGNRGLRRSRATRTPPSGDHKGSPLHGTRRRGPRGSTPLTLDARARRGPSRGVSFGACVRSTRASSCRAEAGLIRRLTPWLSGLGGERVQLGVQPAFCKKVVMSAHLCYAPLIHDHDLVGIPDSGKAVGDDDGSPAPE